MGLCFDKNIAHNRRREVGERERVMDLEINREKPKHRQTFRAALRHHYIRVETYASIPDTRQMKRLTKDFVNGFRT